MLGVGRGQGVAGRAEICQQEALVSVPRQAKGDLRPQRTVDAAAMVLGLGGGRGRGPA